MPPGPSDVTVHHGDCLDVMREMPEASVDAIVTDPPYGLGFMGKAWDDLPPGLPWAQECLRVLKPGGWLLAFGGARTWHRLAVAVEDAGFEMHESLAWLHGQGFPKHKGHLKPAFEPVVRGRKKGTRPSWLNIDACRVAPSSDYGRSAARSDGTTNKGEFFSGDNGGIKSGALADYASPAGRWPTNVVLDGSQADALDEQVPNASHNPAGQYGTARRDAGSVYGGGAGLPHEGQAVRGYGDRGGASRFFPVFRYQAKAPSRERVKVGHVAHPTVKPLELMRWLVRLVTPPGGVVLDPFAGSGTTIEASILEGFQVVGIEREADYLPLIEARIARNQTTGEPRPVADDLLLFGDDAA